MANRIIPDIVSETAVHTISEKASVREAANQMAEKHIGCLLILEAGRLKGIISERDVMTRVVALGLDADSTHVWEVMTPRVVTISPDDATEQALMLMQEGGFRHLPIVKDGRVLGILSVRDLYAAALGACELELREVSSYIQGETYGVAH